MSLVTTYPWARPHGYNPKLNLKNKNKKKKQASNERPRTATIKKDNKI
jgi:hypothetical protein